MTNAAKKRILIVDDSELIHDLVTAILRECDMELVHVRNGQEAKAQLLDSGSNFAVALVDLILPSDVTGWDILDLIRGNPATAAMRVVVLTGVPMSEEEEQRLLRKADLVMHKEKFRIEGFMAAMGGLLDMRKA